MPPCKEGSTGAGKQFFSAFGGGIVAYGDGWWRLTPRTKDFLSQILVDWLMDIWLFICHY